MDIETTSVKNAYQDLVYISLLFNIQNRWLFSLPPPPTIWSSNDLAIYSFHIGL